jgi:two-component sensor histidine kinase/putative methionine-R-sulfoxide reductase with GAF domain
MSKREKSDSLETKLARVLEYEKSLANLSRVASENVSLNQLLQHVSAVVSRVTHIKHVKVLRYRPAQGDLLLEAGVGWKPGLIGYATFALDSASPAGRSMQTGVPVIIADLPNDKEFRTPPVLRDHNIVAVLNVPIKSNAQSWGLLEVDADKPRSFDDDDVMFLTTAANIVGIALYRQEIEENATIEEARHAKERSFQEMLFREYQHRVKNNLQMILAFLALQQRQAASSDRGLLSGIMDRVHAIALAQDQLSFQSGGGKVEFGDYLRSLCGTIDPLQEKVSIVVDVAPSVFLPLDRAVAAGLIVNELVTNAHKHAFGESGGIIRVSFSVASEIAEALLTVEDDGRGMGPRREGGLGLQLIAGLTDQLNGHFSQEAIERGTRIDIRFPLSL